MSIYSEDRVSYRPFIISTTATMQLLSVDKGVFVTEYKGQRFIHIRQFCMKNGKPVMLSGVSLYPVEWREFQRVMLDVDQSKNYKEIWDLSDRAFMGKFTDGATICFLTYSNFPSPDPTLVPNPWSLSEKFVRLEFDEWETLLSVIHNIE